MSPKSKTRAIFFHLIQHSSKSLYLPSFFSFALEFSSHLQILSLITLTLIHKSSLSNSDTLSWAINKVLSYIAPFNIFNPFTHESNAIIVIGFCLAYFICFFGVLLYILYRFSTGRPSNLFMTKVLSFFTLLHSKVFFYLIHCFLVRALDLSASLDSNLFKYRAPWIIASVLLLILNLIPAVIKELFCFQVHKSKDVLSMKDNLHGLVMLAHKILAVMLYYFIENSNEIVITVNILLSGLNLIILHKRIPHYNITVLKINLVMATVSAWSSLISIGKAIDEDKNIFLFIMLTTGLVIKISLIKLEWTFKNILSLRNLTSYHVVHLPILVQEYRKKVKVFPVQEISNRETIYSIGFSADQTNKTFKMDAHEAIKSFISTDVDKQAYSVISKEILNVLNKYRRNAKNQDLMTLSLVQIYTQVFEDPFRAMLILGKLDQEALSIPARMSLKVISLELESINLQNDSNSSHLNYFTYKLKTQSLKEKIKAEIEEQLKFWKSLNANVVDAMTVINIGSLISSLTRRISRYWQSNFEGSELIYTNAAIMYGLYLEIVQAFPAGGSTMIRKAFQSLHNKTHPFKDVIDIVLGDSAVVIASVEPDKLGKIVDASSSVEEVFKMNRQALIGTNCGIIMPSIIAAKHNDFLKSFYNHSKQSIDRVIKTYAKTLTDEYFSVEISLQLSPFTMRGLNIVACIKKKSDYEPVIIVDHDGNIVEYSKNLAVALNLFMKKSYLKIDTLCPELKLVNQAYNLIYTPPQETEGKNSSSEEIQEDIFLQQQEQEEEMKQTVKEKIISDADLIASPTSKGLLLSSRGDDVAALKTSERFKKILFNDTTAADIPSPQLLLPQESSKDVISLTKEEAEQICEMFKYGKEINFLPLNNHHSRSTSHQNESLKCKIEIEPLIFKGKFYKIFKLKEGLSSNKPHPTSFQQASTAYLAQKDLIPALNSDEFADNFPIDVERDSSTTENHGFSRTDSHDLKKLPLQKAHSQMSSRAVDSQEKPQRYIISETLESAPSKKGKTQSIITSQHSHKNHARQLNNSLKIEKQSASIKLVVNMIYAAIIIIIASICIDLIYANQSMQDMADSMSLIGTVNARLGKTIIAWQAILILYTRSTGLRPIDSRVPKYQAVALDATLDMSKNGQDLMEKVDAFGDNGIVRTFYAKSISFWEPETHILFDNQKIDGFKGHNVITDYNFYYARYNGSILDLANTRKALFTINNTANDFFVALDYTISEISDFFDRTKTTNIHLLEAIVTLETLFVVVPCVLILVILIMTVKLYASLFQAICKIHTHSLAWRIRHLENIHALFNQDIEDNVSYFYSFKWQESVKQHTLANTDKSAYATRKYSGQSLVVYGLRYVLLAFALTAVVIALIINSLHSSTSNLQNLDEINDKVFTVYDVASKVKMVIPSFYFSYLFYNYTDFKLRNQDPESEISRYMDALYNANNVLLEILTNSKGEIDDPVVKDILRGKVCNYCTEPYYNNCMLHSNDESFGLLGLQPKLYDIFRILAEWLDSPIKTQAYASSLMGKLAIYLLDLHFIVYDVHDYLANYLVEQFVDTAQTMKQDAFRIFYINIVVTLAAMALIRIIVLKKLQRLDIGIRRILRIIPYKIIQENKVMSFYLNRVFNNEFKVLQQFA